MKKIKIAISVIAVAIKRFNGHPKGDILLERWNLVKRTSSLAEKR
jgi:hypothetical protein